MAASKAHVREKNLTDFCYYHALRGSAESNVSKRALSLASFLLIRLVTLPYYRTFHFNTLQPIRRIVRLNAGGSTATEQLLSLIAKWRSRKISELQFSSLAVSYYDLYP